MPRHPKPKDLRQNTERVDLGEVPDDIGLEEPVEVPKWPSNWLQSTRESWIRYWRSPARHATVISLDSDTILRLWTLYDLRERSYRQLRKALIVKGSMGQDQPSGFFGVIGRLDGEIRQLEDRLGKHMRSRLILGLRVGGDDRPDEPDEPGDAPAEPLDDDDEPRQDTRLYLVDRGAG